MKIYTKWVKNLKTDQSKQEFLAKLMASKDVLLRLSALIEEDLAASDTNALNKDKYDCANWAYLQADKVGEQRALKKVLKIIDLRD